MERTAKPLACAYIMGAQRDYGSVSRFVVVGSAADLTESINYGAAAFLSGLTARKNSGSDAA